MSSMSFSRSSCPSAAAMGPRAAARVRTTSNRGANRMKPLYHSERGAHACETDGIAGERAAELRVRAPRRRIRAERERERIARRPGHVGCEKAAAVVERGAGGDAHAER